MKKPIRCFIPVLCLTMMHKATFTFVLTFAVCSLCMISAQGQSGTSHKLEISHLTGDFFVFTTYNDYKGTPYPANGMYVVTNAGVIMIDSPWDTTQFQPLLDTINARHNQDVAICIATHFHEDRTGGLEYYRTKGIKTFTTKLTDSLSQQRGMKRAEFLIEKDSLFVIGQYSFKTIYPGKGHAPDNIVVWFEKQRVLYGGCLIKSVSDTHLGNLADASVKDYATTISIVGKQCKNPKFVIPGHNDWSSVKSLQHTGEMARKLLE
jgi:metallo-beta-lactamase class B